MASLLGGSDKGEAVVVNSCPLRDVIRSEFCGAFRGALHIFLFSSFEPSFVSDLANLLILLLMRLTVTLLLITVDSNYIEGINNANIKIVGLSYYYYYY